MFVVWKKKIKIDAILGVYEVSTVTSVASKIITFYPEVVAQI